jgi:hypothetical protein
MKKVLLSLLIVFVLVWNCSIVSAQGKGKGAGREGKRTEKSQRKHKSRQVDANEPSRQGKEKRVREQVQREIHRKDRQKIRVMRGKGKEHQQQLKAIETQMVHEEAKHRRRIARLKRIRELAAKENDTKTVERVAKLMEMELRRHGHKLQRIQEREQKALPLAEKSISEETQKAIKKDADKRKPKAKEKNKVKGRRSKE